MHPLIKVKNFSDEKNLRAIDRNRFDLMAWKLSCYSRWDISFHFYEPALKEKFWAKHETYPCLRTEEEVLVWFHDALRLAGLMNHHDDPERAAKLRRKAMRCTGARQKRLQRKANRLARKALS